MPGLVPGIHVFGAANRKTWMAGSADKCKWDRDKVVLMSFPDEAAFRAWADSPEYLEISKDRKAGADGIVLLARGFGQGA
jgi:uncharacterized protein (DUF1330 family)